MSDRRRSGPRLHRRKSQGRTRRRRCRWWSVRAPSSQPRPQPPRPPPIRRVAGFRLRPALRVADSSQPPSNRRPPAAARRVEATSRRTTRVRFRHDREGSRRFVPCGAAYPLDPARRATRALWYNNRPAARRVRRNHYGRSQAAHRQEPLPPPRPRRRPRRSGTCELEGGRRRHRQGVADARRNANRQGACRSAIAMGGHRERTLRQGWRCHQGRRGARALRRSESRGACEGCTGCSSGRSLFKRQRVKRKLVQRKRVHVKPDRRWRESRRGRSRHRRWHDVGHADGERPLCATRA